MINSVSIHAPRAGCDPVISATIEDFERALEWLRRADYRTSLDASLFFKADTQKLLGRAMDFFADVCDELQRAGIIQNAPITQKLDETLGDINVELLDADNAERMGDFK